ncbi:MAG: DMT family transporter [Actinomycetales bacterium]
MTASRTDASPGHAPAPAPRLPWQVKYAALGLIWGSSFLLIMVGLRAFEPIQISTVRVLFGTGALLVLMRVAGSRLPRDPRVWWYLAVTGFFLGTLPFTLFAIAETRIPSALAGIANSSTPLASVIFGLMLLPDVRLDRVRLAAVLTGFGGVLLILQPWQVEQAPDLFGFGAALVGGASYGLGWTLVKRWLGDVPLRPFALPTGQMLCAAVQLLVLLGLWWAIAGRSQGIELPWSAHPHPDGPVWLSLVAIAALGLLGTGLAMAFQADVVRATSPTVATTVTYLIPVVAVGLGVLVLGESLQPVELAGAGVVLASAVVISSPRRKLG